MKSKYVSLENTFIDEVKSYKQGTKVPYDNPTTQGYKRLLPLELIAREMQTVSNLWYRDTDLEVTQMVHRSQTQRMYQLVMYLTMGGSSFK